MSWLIRTSLQFRLLVIVLAIALVIVGVRTSDSVPLDVFPEFAPPLVEIQTEAPGISTEDVESLITVPIENAVNGIPFVQTVRSKSVLGLSSVPMIFEPGTTYSPRDNWFRSDWRWQPDSYPLLLARR
ncbi:MAG: efflux RND transporter permease subunit [Rubripirellula sp.]